MMLVFAVLCNANGIGPKKNGQCLCTTLDSCVAPKTFYLRFFLHSINLKKERIRNRNNGSSVECSTLLLAHKSFNGTISFFLLVHQINGNKRHCFSWNLIEFRMVSCFYFCWQFDRIWNVGFEKKYFLDVSSQYFGGRFSEKQWIFDTKTKTHSFKINLFKKKQSQTENIQSIRNIWINEKIISGKCENPFRIIFIRDVFFIIWSSHVHDYRFKIV